MSPSVPSEHEEQVYLAKYLDLRGVLWCHVPNETGTRHGFGLRRRMEAEGVKPGVPDVLVFGPFAIPGGFLTVIPGIAIELKRPGSENDTRPSQEDWLHSLDARGWHTFVGNADEAIEFLKARGI